MDILLNKLEAYQYINPQIVLVVQRSKQIVDTMMDREPASEGLVKSFELRLSLMYETAYNEINENILQAVDELGSTITGKKRRQDRGSIKLDDQDY